MRNIFVSIFIIGFLSLCYETLALRIFFYFFAESSQSVAIVISAFLIGLAIGSGIYAKFSKVILKSRYFIPISNLICAGIFYSIFKLENLPLEIYSSLIQISNSFVLNTILSASYLIAPTIFLGMYFPYYLDKAKELNPKKTLGGFYFTDLIGSVIGTIITGFVFLPELGSQITVEILVIIHIIFSIAHLPKKMRNIAIILPIVLILLFSTQFFNSEEKPLNKEKISTVLFEEESEFGKITVRENKNSHLELVINKRVQCSTEYTYDKNRSELLIAEKALKAKNQKNLTTLNIGLGCGFTSSVFGNNESVKNHTIIEINDKVVLASQYFNAYTNNITTKENVNLIIDNGFFYLQNTSTTYDIIVIDIENPAIIHSSNLYTVEAFDMINKILKKNGVFGLWAYSGSKEYLSIIYNTLNTKFTNIKMFYAGKDYQPFFLASNNESMFNEFEKSSLNLSIKETKGLVNTLDKKTLEKYWTGKKE